MTMENYQIPKDIILGLAKQFDIIARPENMTGKDCWNEIRRIHKELAPHFMEDDPTYKALTELLEENPYGY